MGGQPYPRSRGIALAATFAALTSVVSPISIPLGPLTPVPITLQVFFVYLALALLGPLYGTLSMVIYLLLGAAGLPVFAGLSGGGSTLFGYEGGYLFGFAAACLLGGIVGTGQRGLRANHVEQGDRVRRRALAEAGHAALQRSERDGTERNWHQFGQPQLFCQRRHNLGHYFFSKRSDVFAATGER